MNNDNFTPQMYLISKDIIRVENALVEEVFTDSSTTGHVLISYDVTDQNNLTGVNQVSLNVGRNTIIINENGENLSLNDLSEGMRIDAEFSTVMTRSIPPQSQAYRIVVLNEEPNISVTVDRVVGVDTSNGFLLTGNPYDMYDQKIFNISDTTIILDQNDMPIPLEAIQPGQMVRVEHAIFQTLSIPPQSPAYLVQVL